MPPPVLAALGGADCEAMRSGWLAQPANATSSLAFVAVGGWLLVRSAAPGCHRVSLLTAGGALTGVGLASAAYHGPQPPWAEPAHDGTIAALAAVMAGHGVWWLARRFRPDRTAPAGGRRWWLAAGGFAAAGLVAYVAGRTGGPLCRPESLWQPHAIWHALIAAALATAVVAAGEGENGAATAVVAAGEGEGAARLSPAANRRGGGTPRR